MKKLVLKKWVEVVLGVIWACLIMFIASECIVPIMYLFHLVAIILFILVSAIIIKYGKDYE